MEGEHLDQLFSLQLSLFEPILRVCREEEVRRFVRVDGALAGPELSRLQARAAEGGCTALAVYCGSVLGLGTQTIQAQAQTCFRTLMDQTARGNAQERQEAVRLIQLLFREEYESNQAELFPIRLQAILKTLPSQEGTAGLTNMLTPTLSRAALEAMLRTPYADDQEVVLPPHHPPGAVRGPGGRLSESGQYGVQLRQYGGAGGGGLWQEQSA